MILNSHWLLKFEVWLFWIKIFKVKVKKIFENLSVTNFDEHEFVHSGSCFTSAEVKTCFSFSIKTWSTCLFWSFSKSCSSSIHNKHLIIFNSIIFNINIKLLNIIHKIWFRILKQYYLNIMDINSMYVTDL